MTEGNNTVKLDALTRTTNVWFLAAIHDVQSDPEYDQVKKNPMEGKITYEDYIESLRVKSEKNNELKNMDKDQRKEEMDRRKVERSAESKRRKEMKEKGETDPTYKTNFRTFTSDFKNYMKCIFKKYISELQTVAKNTPLNIKFSGENLTPRDIEFAQYECVARAIEDCKNIDRDDNYAGEDPIGLFDFMLQFIKFVNVDEQSKLYKEKDPKNYFNSLLVRDLSDSHVHNSFPNLATSFWNEFMKAFLLTMARFQLECLTTVNYKFTFALLSAFGASREIINYLMNTYQVLETKPKKAKGGRKKKSKNAADDEAEDEDDEDEDDDEDDEDDDEADEEEDEKVEAKKVSKSKKPVNKDAKKSSSEGKKSAKGKGKNSQTDEKIEVTLTSKP